MWYIYTIEYYSAIKKEQNNAICSNMDRTRDSQTEWSKSERERQIPYDITYDWNLIYNTNEPFHRKEKKSELYLHILALLEGSRGTYGKNSKYNAKRLNIFSL